MPKIFIDGKAYEAREGVNLLHAVISVGLNLEYFCWHPALGSVGACRQCAVKQFKDEKDTRGKIVMACMTPAAEGTHIAIEDPEVKQFRASVIEWLMTNHPHDCPVCDEGGECHLQDMTLMSGHNYRRYHFLKRTHRNQYLGPFVNHEMNRCIACYRCVRYYRDYAGGKDLDVFAVHNDVYFGRAQDGILENEFSGNLVEVCPTGVFTDKTLKQHYTRKWDMQYAPSVCHHCSVGCNTTAGERYGSLRRIINRYNDQVNGYFLCDRGRFGYGFVDSSRRIRTAFSHDPGSNTDTEITKEAALERIGAMIAGAGGVIGIGSPRASIESNYALRMLVGKERFYSGMSAIETKLVSKILDALRRGPARTPSLHEIEQSDAVLILGEDLTNTAPMVALALRQAARRQPMARAAALKVPAWDDQAVRELLQGEHGPFYVATPAATRLDDIASKTYRAAPDDIALFGYAIAHHLDAVTPMPDDASEELIVLAGEVAAALRGAERPLIISGTSVFSEQLIDAAAIVASSLWAVNPRTQVSFIVPECNSLGAGLLEGKPLDDAIEQAREGNVDTIIVIENDLYRRAPSNEVDTLLASARHVIAIDYLHHQTTPHAAITLPASTFAEASGTLINNEGRAQRFFAVAAPASPVQESWRWLRDMMRIRGRAEGRTWESLDDILDSISSTIPPLTRIRESAPESDFRIAGQRIPREPHRFSGRTAMFANTTMFEPKPPGDPDSPLAHSMEGYSGQPPPPLIPFFWSAGWNSIQSTNKYQQEVGSLLKGGTPGVRLIEPLEEEGKDMVNRSFPKKFRPQKHTWLAVPLYHIFGSEELSAHSPGIAELIPALSLAMNSEDMKELQLQENTPTEVKIGERNLSLPAHPMLGLPRGVIGLPVGLPGIGWVTLPEWATVSKVQTP